MISRESVAAANISSQIFKNIFRSVFRYLAGQACRQRRIAVLVSSQEEVASGSAEMRGRFALGNGLARREAVLLASY